MESDVATLHHTYSRADRFLHKVALGSRAVMETTFDIENGLYGRAARAIVVDRPLFVCGLARAGTSLVTRLIEAGGAFATPTYRSMPFPLAPNLWSRLSSGKRRTVKSIERGHDDGMMHDLDSPEAIEEVFWRCFEGDKYISADALRTSIPEPQSIDRFSRYLQLVMLVDGKPRYLSKNNNNVLRLSSIILNFPDAILVHPFRKPGQQAASLMRQHVRSFELQAADPFRRNYMLWLGHHEFGQDHRPFLFDGQAAPSGDPIHLDYWLETWCSVYRHLLSQPADVRDRQYFLDYDALIADPDAETARLSASIAAPLGSGGHLERRSPHALAGGAANLGDCPEIYEALVDRSRKMDAADYLARRTRALDSNRI